MTTSTLQLACPTCRDEIEVEVEYYEIHRYSGQTEVVSLKTSCSCPLSRQEAYALLMDYGARQAELATEGAN